MSFRGQFKKLLFWPSLIAICFIFSAQVSSASIGRKSCEAILGNYEEISQLTHLQLSGVKKDFQHNTRYTREVKRGFIKDQCAWGGCWAFSLSSVLESNALSRGKKIELDPRFLMALQIVTRGLQQVQRYGRQHSQAENLPYSLELAKTYGLVPKDVWIPRVDITQNDISSRFHFFVNHIVEKFQLAYFGYEAKLKSYQEKDVTTLSVEDLDTIKMYQVAQSKVLELAQNELMKLITTFMGPLPERFEYDGKIVTPVEFAHQNFELDKMGLLSVSPNIERAKVPEGFFSKKGGSPHNSKLSLVGVEATFEFMEKLIVKQIDKGHAVWTAINWQKAFVDTKTGIMSIGAFYNPFADTPIDRPYLDVFGEKSGHAVAIIGYELGPDGRVIKFKVQNSWGLNSGDAGIYHLYRDYFEAFILNISILLPEKKVQEIEALKDLPNELEMALKKL